MVILGQLTLPLLITLEHVGFISLPLAVVLAGWGFWGISGAMLSCFWIAGRKSGAPLSSALYGIFLSAGFASALILCIPQPAGIGMLLCAQAMSLIFFLRDLSREGASYGAITLPSQSFHKSLFNQNGSYIMGVDGALLGFAGCIFMVLIFQYGAPDALLGFAVVISMLVVFMVNWFKPALLSSNRFQLVSMPFLMVSLALANAKHPLCLVGAFMLFVASYVFDYANFSVLAIYGRFLHLSSAYCFSKGRVFITAGKCLGWGLGAMVALNQELAPTLSVTLMVLVCSYIAIAALFPEKYPFLEPVSRLNKELRFDESTVEKLESCEPPKEEQKTLTEETKQLAFLQKCNLIAAGCKLTTRETEVLFYLARGRSARYIANALYITERTVKTHIQHIYQKVGTHSRQELIDIVESAE